MLHSIAEAAAILGRSPRQIARAAHDGIILAEPVAGILTIPSRAIIAAERSSGRGRRWNAPTVQATWELLETGTTQTLPSSERSRLKQRLRQAEPRDLAYQLIPGKVSLWRRTTATGTIDALSVAAALRLSTGGGLTIDVGSDPGGRARMLRLARDGDGDVALVDVDHRFRAAAEALTLYAYGADRESSAATAWLKMRATNL